MSTDIDIVYDQILGIAGEISVIGGKLAADLERLQGYEAKVSSNWSSPACDEYLTKINQLSSNFTEVNEAMVECVDFIETMVAGYRERDALAENFTDSSGTSSRTIVAE